MDIQERWEKALRETEIIRTRIQSLSSVGPTNLPYIFLSSSISAFEQTAVCQGEVVVEKPSLLLPSDFPQFEGFDFGSNFSYNENTITNFLLVRGIRFPSLKYNNKLVSAEQFHGSLDQAGHFYRDQLQRREDVHTGLLSGPADCWQFSVIIFICSQIVKSAEGDVRKLLNEFKRGNNLN